MAINLYCITIHYRKQFKDQELFAKWILNLLSVRLLAKLFRMAVYNNSIVELLNTQILKNILIEDILVSNN